MASFALTTDKRLNILVIQSCPVVSNLVGSLLTSSMLRVEYADSIAHVRKKVVNSGITWHCWILDPNLDGNENGINLIREFSHFPFIIVLASNGTMRLAFKAAQLGVIDVFDHLPGNCFDELVDSIIHTVILGFLLDAKHSDYLPIFLALKKSIVTTVPDWARQAYISQRYLERICEKHFGLPPRYVLPLYYHLLSKLRFSLTGQDNFWQVQGYNSIESVFFRNCNEFVKRRITPAMSFYPFVQNRFNHEWLSMEYEQKETALYI